MEELVLSAKETQLTLGIPLVYDEKTAVVDVAPTFGASYLWWKEREILVGLPPFHFKFLLALNSSDVNADHLHASLLYMYMRALKLGKKAEYEISHDADRLAKLRQATVKATVLSADHVLFPGGQSTRDVEVLLGHTHQSNVQRMYAERSRAWRQAHAEESGEESTGPLHRLFDIEYMNPTNSLKPCDAFQTIVQVSCLNHAIAANLIAELLPSTDRPKGKAFEYNNPPVGAVSYGRQLFVGDQKLIVHLLAPHIRDGYRALFRFAASAQDFAVAHVASQLGSTQALVQTVIQRVSELLGPWKHQGMMLVSHASPFQNDVFLKAGALPKKTLLASTRIYTQTDGVADFNATIVKLHDIAYWGVLTIGCRLERRFATTAPRAPAPVRHAGGMDVSVADLKRLRDVKEEEEDNLAESPAKRTRVDTEQ